MRTSPRTTLLLAAALPLLAGACREGARPAPQAADVRRYDVRAELVGVAREGSTARVTLRHEAIPQFTDASGKVVGMGSMVMTFDVAPGVAVDALRPGDEVEARLAVGWSPPLMRVERLVPLPPGTPLRFGAGPAGDR